MGIWAARLIYAGIGTQVRRNACDSISMRAHTSKAQKLGWMVKAGLWAAGDSIMPRSAVIYASPLSETTFLVDAASRAVPERSRTKALLDVLADLRTRELALGTDTQGA